MPFEPEGWYMDAGPPSWDAVAKTSASKPSWGRIKPYGRYASPREMGIRIDPGVGENLSVRQRNALLGIGKALAQRNAIRHSFGRAEQYACVGAPQRFSFEPPPINPALIQDGP